LFPDRRHGAVLSHEHREAGLFTEDEVAGLRMPAGYQRSIANWFGQLAVSS
jgi:hypothetical protein